MKFNASDRKENTNWKEKYVRFLL